MIRYQVLANPLRDGEYFPWVMVDQTVQMSQTIESIVRETGLSDTDVKAVANALSQQTILALLNGNNIAIEGLGTFSLSLSEKLDSVEAAVSDAVEVHVNAHADVAILDRVSKDAQFKKVVKPPHVPIITGFQDVATRRIDQYIAGSIVTLSGEDLKFNTESTDEGVFFIAEDGSEVRVTVYSRAGETKIDCLAPIGLAGVQTVELRTTYISERLRSGTYNNPVTSL
jgi:predicted histone-like DNA-binding protein